jgi:UDP-N-acetylmuramoyl-tripeptide--D-alanyl-D-alanine ligase
MEPRTVPQRLTLDALRQYVRQTGIGILEVSEPLPAWETPLGPAVQDSRSVVPGGLFVALPGERTDGHQFIGDAVARGAAAVIAARQPTEPFLSGRSPVLWLVPDPLSALQRFAAWWRTQFPALRVVGITGSVGKTTAKEVLAHALGALLPVLASPKSFNNEIGLPLTLLSLTGRHAAAVLEMGMYDVGDIAFLAGIARQTIGVVLNVEAVHLERAGTIERIAQAKAEMIRTLEPGGTAVLNADDPRVRAMAAVAPGPVLTFGLHEGVDWRAVEVEPFADGLALVLARGGRRYPLRSSLPGRHHAYALLAAAAAMEAAGVAIDAIVPALATVPAPALRQRFIRLPDGMLVIDDTYNASPLSVLAALDVLAAQPARRRVAILADMLELGPVAEESHRRVGMRAGEVADLVLAVGPLSCSLADAAGLAAKHFADKAALRPALADLVRPGDAVLVKGSRGMAMEEVVSWLCQTQ